MGRAIKLVLYYFAYQLAFTFLVGLPAGIIKVMNEISENDNLAYAAGKNTASMTGLVMVLAGIAMIWHLIYFKYVQFNKTSWTESTAKQELPACPVETTLTLISDKWKVLILRDLMNGTMRFGELKKSIGHVTQKVLTAQLRQMEASGLLTRKVYAEVPPRVEYTLTELGYSLKPVMDALWKWGENYQAQCR